MTGICAIHQPNFFPWLGYFDKIRRADIFVVLDGVVAPRAAGWINRVGLDVQGESRFFTCPVRRGHGAQTIAELRINPDGHDGPWRPKFLRTLEVNYGRARNFTQTRHLIERLLAFEDDQIAAFNLNAIQAICRILGVGARFVRHSDLDVPDCAKTELLIALTRAVGCDRYLCGGGAAGYQDDALIAARGIQLIYQNFQPSPYGDPASFRPGLSVIDYLMKTEDSLAWETA